MLTGREIREARALLGLNRTQLASKVKRITTLAIMRAEEAGDEPILSAEQNAVIRETLEHAGIVFGSHGVMLRGEVPRGARRGGLKSLKVRSLAGHPGGQEGRGEKGGGHG